MTIPDPRGKKSQPTKLSSTEDLPLLCEPTTTIWGSEGAATLPSKGASACCSLLNTGSRRSML